MQNVPIISPFYDRGTWFWGVMPHQRALSNRLGFEHKTSRLRDHCSTYEPSRLLLFNQIKIYYDPIRKKWGRELTSWQVLMTIAILEMRSAACCLTLAALLLRRHRIVPQIWGRYAFTRLPRAFTMVPKPFSITESWEWMGGNTLLVSAWTWHVRGIY